MKNLVGKVYSSQILFSNLFYKVIDQQDTVLTVNMFSEGTMTTLTMQYDHFTKICGNELKD